MSAMNIEDKIEDSQLLTDIFGRFPSFHDAEVMSVKLERKEKRRLPTLELTIHVFEMTAVVVNGSYVLKNHTLVTFLFEEIDGLTLEGFNHQNTLQGLQITDISNRQLESLKFEVSIDGNFGLEGEFACKTIKILTASPFEM